MSSGLPRESAASDEGRRFFELGRAVAGEQDLPSVFRLALETITELVGPDDAFIFVSDETPGATTPTLRACMHGVPPKVSGDHALEATAIALATHALRLTLTADSSNTTAFEVLPLLSGEDRLGCLIAGRSSARPFDEHDRRRLRGVGDYLAMALHSAEQAARQQHHARELQLLTKVASDSSELGLDRFMPAVVEQVGRSLHLDLVALYFLQPEQDELVWACGWTSKGPMNPTLPRIPSREGVFGRILDTRQPSRTTADELPLPSWQTAANRLDVSYFAAVPLVVKDRAIGVFLTARRNGPVLDDELRLLVAVCVQISVAADNTRLLVEANRRAADLALVQSIGVSMSQSLSAMTVLRTAMGATREALGADGIHAYRRRGGMFESVVYRGIPSPAADEWKWLGEDHALITRAITLGHAVEIIPSELGEPARSMLARTPVGSLAAVPLRLSTENMEGGETSVGVVLVGRRSSRRFVESEIRMLDAVAGQLTIALRNADLFEETQRRAEDLAVVYEAGRALLEGVALDAMLDRASKEIARLAGVRDCIFLLVDSRQGVLRGKMQATKGAHEFEVPFDSNAIAARAFRIGDKVEARDMEHRALTKAANLTWTPRWGLALPLGPRDQPLAVMVLTDPDEHRELPTSDLERVRALGNQVAIAIDRSRILARLSEAQQELVKRERLAALGGLSALVAHEVRNPLGVITTSLGLLSKLIDLDGDAMRVFEIIREETSRIEQIVNDMLGYTRPTAPSLAPARLDRVLGDAVASATTAEQSRGTNMEVIRTIVTSDPALPPIPMDDRLLHQALVNLLSNAYQSLNGPGAVRVDASMAEDGAHVRLSVEDDGPGIDEAARIRLFEPFFTTKAKGSGLGLAMVKRIVDDHKWTIDVETELGRGTRFVITLPAPRT